MRLFHFATSNCQSIIDIIPGISLVYEMESKFSPYLVVEFLPRDENETRSGVILLTKSGPITRYYDFKDPKTRDDLENFVWNHIAQTYNIKEVDVGHENDTREYKDNIVIQGWQEKKRISARDICCKKILDAVTHSIMDNLVLHEIYKLKGGSIKDKETCKKVRWTECGNNYPESSPTFQRCVDEVEWLCNNGYPVNEQVDKMNQLVDKVRKDIYNYLVNNDMKVDKRKFDEIIDAGFFADLGNRMGNKVANDPHTRASINDIFTEKDYYLYLLEGFEEKPQHNYEKWFGLFILIVIIGLIYMAYRNRVQ